MGDVDKWSIPRGGQESSPAGRALFIGLRALDVPLQYGILSGTLSSPLLALFGTSFLVQGPGIRTGISLIDALDLSPYRLALLAMDTGASLKQIIHLLFIGQETVYPQLATMVGVAQSVFNGVGNLLFVCAATSIVGFKGAGVAEAPGDVDWPPVQLFVGGSLVGLGLAYELYSEVERHLFKKKPENKGKPYTGGLWSLSRHPNYFGFLLWRSGIAVASGGWTWAALIAALVTRVFTADAIPELEAYCEKRYADMWKDYKKKTPATLVPFVF